MSRLIQALCATFVLMVFGLSVAGEEREGGITGTGIVPAGIVGTVTQLGSIWVNGQHIRFEPNLPVTDGVLLTSAADIRPGHTLAVSVIPDSDGWQAVSIRQITSLVGPVTEADENWILVMGTRVEVSERDHGLQPGQWVAVSGLWRDDTVVASRLDPLPEATVPARIMGSAFPQEGALKIGNSLIDGIPVRHVHPGEVALAIGQPTVAGLLAERVEVGLFGSEVGVVQAGGYLSPPRAKGMYTLLGSGLVAYTDRPEMIDAAENTIRCGYAGALSEIGTLPTNEAVAGSWALLGCK